MIKKIGSLELRRPSVRLFLILILGTLFVGSLVNGLTLGIPQASATATISKSPVFVWLFGYTGPYFLPQVQLNLTPAQTISAVQNLGRSIGKSNLILVSVVGEEPNQPPWGITNVNWKNSTQVTNLKNYVSTLKKFASGVYARLDFEEFNVSSSPSIYTEVSRFVDKIGVNGFWLDHGPNLYNTISQSTFNYMMQKISISFPNITFLMNDGVKCPSGLSCKAPGSGWISPLGNDTWQKHTYISPSLQSNTYNMLNLGVLGNLSEIWSCTSCPTRGEGMVLHFDAYAQVSTEPMGLFANQTSKIEISTIQLLVNEGIPTNSSYSGYSYYLMYPILGAATYNGTIAGGKMDYRGTLYNSLSVGTYHRGTLKAFMHIMSSP